MSSEFPPLTEAESDALLAALDAALEADPGAVLPPTEITWSDITLNNPPSPQSSLQSSSPDAAMEEINDWSDTMLNNPPSPESGPQWSPPTLDGDGPGAAPDAGAAAGGEEDDNESEPESDAPRSKRARSTAPSNSLIICRMARNQLSQLEHQRYGRISLVPLAELGDHALDPACFAENRGPQELFDNKGFGCSVCNAAADGGPDERCAAFFPIVTPRAGYVEKTYTVGVFYKVVVNHMEQPKVLLVGCGKVKKQWMSEPRVGKLQWASSNRHNIEIDYQTSNALSDFLAARYPDHYQKQKSIN